MKLASVIYCYIFIGFIVIAGATLVEDHSVSAILLVLFQECQEKPKYQLIHMTNMGTF